MWLVLASASPRRRELLGRLGLPFEVRPSGVDEVLRSDLPAADQATALARAKAADVAAQLGARDGAGVVLGADTLVVLDARPIGKPGSRDEARAMLRALRGRTHEVVTALAALAVPQGREVRAAVTSRVTMRPFTEAEIDAYVATGEPDDKAGAYGAQGLGARLVARIDGCVTNVIGLPLTTTARLLRALGLEPVLPDDVPGR